MFEYIFKSTIEFFDYSYYYTKWLNN